MKNSSIISLLLSSMISVSAHADISRQDFIDQLDSANCSLVPPEIFLDTSSQDYDFANALSLSWISLAALEDQSLSYEQLSEQWQLSNIQTIDNDAHDLRILIADYQDTTLVTFRHTDSNKNWLYNADYGLWQFSDSFTLGETVHHGFARMLSAEWANLVKQVKARSTENSKLYVFGHSLGGALAQLSAAGFEQEGLHVDQVYLTGSPKVGSDAWVAKADALLGDKVHRLVYEDDLIAHLPIHHQALPEFRSIFSIVPEFIASSIGGVRSLMKFDTLGRQINLNQQAQSIQWSSTDSAAIEQQYWLDMSAELAQAKHSSWNPITQVQGMLKVVAGNMENHLLRSDTGYFCAMINALESE